MFFFAIRIAFLLSLLLIFIGISPFFGVMVNPSVTWIENIGVAAFGMFCACVSIWYYFDVKDFEREQRFYQRNAHWINKIPYRDIEKFVDSKPHRRLDSHIDHDRDNMRQGE